MEAVLVILIFNLAGIVEKWCMVYVRNLLVNSIAQMPSTAHMKDGSSKEIEDIKIGSIIVVSPGDEIVLDGVIVEGKGLVD